MIEASMVLLLSLDKLVLNDVNSELVAGFQESIFELASSKLTSKRITNEPLFTNDVTLFDLFTPFLYLAQHY